jgi:endonuclease III
MKAETLENVLKILRKEIKRWKVPAVGAIADEAADQEHGRPFETLVSTILSLRTKDVVTEGASRRLLAKAHTPQKILALAAREIEKLIYPVCFYRNKAQSLLKTCKILIDQHDGRVPGTMEALLALPGVGRKTANLVLTLGFNKYGICVDTHVHRITNLWGYVKTKTPDETEFALRKKLPKKYWKTYNDLLVTFGQNLCVPVSPWCSKCPVERYCEKVGLKRHR